MEQQAYDSEALQQRATELAGGYFRQGYNCTESVYRAFLDLGLSDFPAETVALATGFGGGVASTRNTCGAVLGGVMALGSVFGRREPGALETPRERIHELKQPGGLYDRFGGFVRGFQERYGSIVCSELTSKYTDFADKERRTSCLQMVEAAAGMAARHAVIPGGE